MIKFDLSGKRSKGTLVRANALTVWAEVPIGRWFREIKYRSEGRSLFGRNIRVGSAEWVNDFKVIKRHRVKHHVEGAKC